ncbi:MAG: tetratricopeptide repeat protein, partial [Planctomycetes bacterium]|nr:tetratricopeptide repeat protein [Planctomycetota bacterium]
MKRRFALLPLMAATVLLLAFAASGAQAQFVSDYITRGEQYLAAGAADNAIFQFEQALSMEPSNTRALFGLGRGLEMRAKVSVVLNYRMELLSDTSAAREQGFPVLTDQGYADVERAVDAYTRAAQGWPRYTEGYLRAANLRWASGMPDAARDLAQRALNDDPSAVGAAVLAANIMADAADYAGATAVLDRAAAASGDRGLPALVGAYALIQLKQSRPEQAISLLVSAAGRADAPAYIFKYLGDAYTASGQHQQATDAYQQAVARDSESILSRDALGRSLRLAGEHALAAQHL